MQSSFIDPRMVTNLASCGHFPSLCDIQAVSESFDANETLVKTWADVAGLTDIPCSVALSSGKKVKDARLEYGITTHTISLGGAYTTITRLNRAVVDGVTYEIQYVSPAGFENSVTVLECTVVS